MKKISDETIVAPATPPGRGGVAIVRISGPLVISISKKMLGCVPQPRYAHYSKFNSSDGIIDEGLALYFPAPHSFTGEDILELHGHGGPAVVNHLLQNIVTLGARLARPGEFSERAFLNGKIDLAQAEAIADLIDASSEQAVRASLRSLQGEFSKKIHQLVTELIHLRMYVEAAIDFSEEEIDFLADKQISENLNSIIQKLDLVQSSAIQGSLLRDGMTIVIAGKPNVGKSSLMNYLSGREIAIVTDVPGTTRDILRQEIILDGMPVHFIDTAGLRDSPDLVEQIGIQRAWEEISRADLILCLMDARDDNLNVRNLLNNISVKIPMIIVRNKIDLTCENESIVEKDNETFISLSVKTGKGMELLIEHIKSCVGFKTNMEGVFSARRRHLDALQRAKEFLISGHKQLSDFRAGELLAEDLRQAQQSLNEITGDFTTDDLLGKIFGSFCVGK